MWYDGRPPGQQPAPTSCREAERIASRDRFARVIYGDYGDDRRSSQRDDRWDADDRPERDARERERAIPRRRSDYPYPDQRYPSRRTYPGARGGYGYDSVPFDNGYRDGYEKGREDARDRDSYDPVRHGRYRSGDRGYNSRYGTKEDYKHVYRDGFEAGYDEGYRAHTTRAGERRGVGLPWPF